MTPVTALTVAVSFLPFLDQKVPDPNDVKPGPLAVLVFVFLALAVVFLLFSFRKQLRKVDSSLPYEKGPKSSDVGENTNGAGANPHP